MGYVTYRVEVGAIALAASKSAISVARLRDTRLGTC